MSGREFYWIVDAVEIRHEDMSTYNQFSKIGNI
jgi:hypothetical protein